MSKTKNIRTCEYCKWYEAFAGVCTNGESDYCADFVENDHQCEAWKPKEVWGPILELYNILEYGDNVELANGDECVLVRRELDTSGGIVTQEIVLINIFTGVEHSINLYDNNLEHSTNPALNIKIIISKEAE